MILIDIHSDKGNACTNTDEPWIKNKGANHPILEPKYWHGLFVGWNPEPERHPVLDIPGFAKDFSGWCKIAPIYTPHSPKHGHVRLSQLLHLFHTCLTSVDFSIHVVLGIPPNTSRKHLTPSHDRNIPHADLWKANGYGQWWYMDTK